MTDEKEIRIPCSFTCLPSIMTEAKENAWSERKSLSMVIEKMLKDWNQKKAKEKKLTA